MLKGKGVRDRRPNRGGGWGLRWREWGTRPQDKPSCWLGEKGEVMGGMGRLDRGRRLSRKGVTKLSL